jgi:hypothetical protein
MSTTRLPAHLLINGVQVGGLGPIGVSIDSASDVATATYEHRATGTTTGGDNSATSWSTRTNSYQVYLYCVNNPDLGWSG